MSFVNYKTKEIHCKIVYYGPGLSGKTTNLQFIYNRTNPATKGRLISLATETERTLFFDFLPLAIGKIRGFNLRFHLYTVPGQVFYDASRKLILRGADGIIFVADSQVTRFEANLESLRNLEEHLKKQGIPLKNTPHIIQYNKRDLTNISPVAQLSQELNHYSVPEFESIAIKGFGVFDSLKTLAKLILKELKAESPSASPHLQREDTL
ncbi:MAG TPA: ADP-ribosylation factor-like protein [Bdellovibrionota bacterium]|nr:ADP-ribosylation factor-like protein [Bdellovibrionota bacterium]